MHKRAPKIHDKLQDAIQELEDVENQVAQLQLRKTGTARDFKDWIEELAEASSLPESRPTLAERTSRSSGGIPTVITERYLADLTRRLKRARHRRIRFIDEWDYLVRNAARAQAILDSSASKQLDFGQPPPHASFIERTTILTPYSRYLVYVYIQPGFRYFLSILGALASISIVWSEIVKAVDAKLSIINLTVVHRPTSDQGQVGFAGQVIAAAWLLYMCAAALTSINEVKVWGNRALVRRNTYGESACWYAGQVARLTVPLAFNFITCLPQSVFRGTVFYQFLGRLISLTPLGANFDKFFPILVLVPVFATLFNLYGKVKKIFGFGVIEEEDDDENASGYGTGNWREGRELIERELHGNSSLTYLHGRRMPSPSGTSSPSRRHLVENNPNNRSAPVLSVPGRERTSQTNPASSTVATSAQTRPSREESTPEDENIFDSFAHRLRNTFDTAEAPKWMRDLDFKRPKWMGGTTDSEQSSSTSQSGGYRRLFGGRSSTGRIRL
jgi:hypothetical protein